MPHLGHDPGASERTSGCIEQAYGPCAGALAGLDAGARSVSDSGSSGASAASGLAGWSRGTRIET